MKSKTKYFLQDPPEKRFSPWKKMKYLLLILLTFIFQIVHAQNPSRIQIAGSIHDSTGMPLPKVTVVEKGTKNVTTTDDNGNFSISVASERSSLVFSSVGYNSKEIKVNSQTNLTVVMEAANTGLGEVVVVGYGSKKRESITGSVATVTAKDIDRVHGGSTVSSGLAGKLPGVTFRMPDGRPGASANIQIRNMGTPLYVIDGIQQDEGQFNNLAPDDIESITILKDGSAAIYGVRAANGVVVVTTKKGRVGERNTINVNAYAGWENWFRFPNVLTSSYDYMRYKAEAEINSFGSTAITQAELDKYKAGTDPAYRSFNWRDYVMQKNASQNSVNLSASGGSDKINYYLSGTNVFQNSVLGREYKFNRSNLQSNVNAQIAKGLKVGMQINGRIETRENPGVPGLDDYWLARFAVLRNTPLERPYANDNPDYLNDIGHTETNYAFLNKKISGVYHSDWRVLQTNVSAEYQIPGVKGLSVKGLYSYYIADYVLNNHEYTYNAYTYNPTTQNYDVTGGSINPWREREQIKQINTTTQGQISYNNTFGEHNISATVVTERIKTQRLRNWIHASPTTNVLPLIYFATADRYEDSKDETARIGYIGRVSYNYANRYYIEGSARRDASFLFAPDKRVGYFPGISGGWRTTEENFMKNLLGPTSVLNDLKFRASYGVLGDDYPNGNWIVAPFAYLPGYVYNQGVAILDGNAVVGSRDKGVPVSNISWLKSKITDVGVDFSLFNRKLTGTIDYFYRKRTGLLDKKQDIQIPREIGYVLGQENINSDAQYGEEFSLAYNNKIGQVMLSVSGNIAYTRSKFLDSYKPKYFNSWDQYRNGRENRFNNISWGYEVTGQFQSQEEINNYKVNIDGKGNRTLLPGDLIYKDQNGDGMINGMDERPIGFGYGNQPNINFGFSLGLAYKGFDFHADFSGASGYTWFQNWETRWPFQNNGNLNTIFLDRWHHTDPFDVNSPWVAGKYPVLRWNPGNGYSDYGNNSTFWQHNITYLRARTIELGYSLSSALIRRIKMQKARFYLNAYNLFSLDNMKQFGLDPEVIDDNGLQFPQNTVVNVGVNLSF